MRNNTISSIATGKSVGGVGIIRLSGNGSLSIAEQMFVPSDKRVALSSFEPYKLYTGRILAESFSDYGMCVYFKAPKSFTGEDVIEFHTHGGVAILEGVLKQTFKLGATPASNGEYTKRAFLNGKLSLSACEGLISMINAESEACVRAGFSLLQEKLGKKTTLFQEKITYILALIDANIDFPEDDVKPCEIQEIKDNLNSVVFEINELLKTFSSGKKITDGIKVALVGKPNTGKSSILNSLLNFEKAIVSDIKGTTRDVVEGSILFNGIKFTFYDTAGIRDSTEKIESIGIERSKKMIENADIVLFIIDNSAPFDNEDENVYNFIKTKKHFIIANKIDLLKQNQFDKISHFISALTKENIEHLKLSILNSVLDESIDFNGDFLTEERHFVSFSNAKESLLKVINDIDNVPLDLLSIEIKTAWDYLGEISGLTANENIINEIFSKFCVGK